MDNAAYKALLEANTPLAMLVLRYSSLEEEGLSKVQVISHNNLPEKYEGFVDKLHIQRRPDIIILEDDLAREANGPETFGQYIGQYNGAIHAILLPRCVYESALLGKSALAEFSVAHEFGHCASYEQTSGSRRALLRRGIALLAGGASAIALNKAMASNDMTDSKRWEMFDLAPYVVGAYVGAVTNKQLAGLAIRAEELLADRYGADAVGLEKMVQGMLECFGKQTVEAIEQAYHLHQDDEIYKGLTPLQRKLTIAFECIDASNQEMTWKRVKAADYYPRPIESLRAMKKLVDKNAKDQPRQL